MNQKLEVIQETHIQLSTETSEKHTLPEM